MWGNPRTAEGFNPCVVLSTGLIPSVPAISSTHLFASIWSPLGSPSPILLMKKQAGIQTPLRFCQCSDTVENRHPVGYEGVFLKRERALPWQDPLGDFLAQGNRKYLPASPHPYPAILRYLPRLV